MYFLLLTVVVVLAANFESAMCALYAQPTKLGSETKLEFGSEIRDIEAFFDGKYMPIVKDGSLTENAVSSI